MRHALAALIFSSCVAADWPSWRGPNNDGTAPGANPPLKWGPKTNVAWKAPLPGKGSSTPVVVGDLVVVTTAVDTGRVAKPEDRPPPIMVPPGGDPDSVRYKRLTRPTGTYHRFLVIGISRKTGKERWRRMVREVAPHEGTHMTHSYAAGSPVTDGKRLYVSFGSFGTYCLDMAGKVLWSRDLGKLETRLGWGEAVTPALHGGKLFVAHDHEGPSFLAALDAKTGKTLWKVPRKEPSNWTTPVVAVVGGKAQVILPGTNRVRAYDAETGEELWQYHGLTVNAIPSAIVRDGVLYCMAGYKGSVGYALKLGKKPELLWKLERGTPYVPSPLLSGDRLWFTSTNMPSLTTIDIKTGKPVLDRVRVGALRQLYASPVAAGGRIYLADRDGTTAVLKEGDKLEVLATNKLGETIDASPAVCGKQLFLRSSKHVWCIEEKGR